MVYAARRSGRAARAGTKNPDLAAIADLKPDIVLANQEENRRVDVERLRGAGTPVWVTVIQTVDEDWTTSTATTPDGIRISTWTTLPRAARMSSSCQTSRIPSAGTMGRRCSRTTG
jgi:hypothetical protein